MKKTLIALAALAATASFAQVTLSGRASMDLSSYQSNGGTTPAINSESRMRVADTSSRIIFAVNEDLGGGMKAGAYCETGFSMDTANANGQAGTANANTSEWCSREGRLYLGNQLAEIRLGRQNVWWTQGEFNSTGSNFLGTDVGSNMFNGGAGNVVTRGANMVMLNANSGAGGFAGSQLYYGYASAAESTAPNKGAYTGFKLLYSVNKLFGAIDYQLVTDAVTTAVAASNVAPALVAGNGMDVAATRYSAGYRYAAGSHVSLQYWTKVRTDKANQAAQYSAANVNIGNASDSGYLVTVNHTFGNAFKAYAVYGKANNITNTPTGDVADSGATGYTLGGTYNLSKRTHVYLAWNKITNDTNANYGFGGGNYQSTTPFAGATTTITALGMQHNF